MEINSEKISVKKNLIYNFLYHIALILVPIISTPYVSRVLGAESIGIYSYAAALVVYFSSAAIFGSGSYGQRAVAFYRDDKKKLSEIFWNSFIFRCISSVVALIFYFIVIVKIDNFTYVKLIASLNVINVAVDISWFFQGLELFKKTILRSLIIKILCVFAIFIFVHDENDIIIYTIIMMSSVLIGNLSLWVFIRKLVNRPSKNIKPFAGMKSMLLLFLPTIATQIYTILDKTMIRWITTSDYQIGCYEQSETIARQILTIITSVAIVILPRVANLYHNDKIENAKKYVYISYHILWIFSFPIVAGIIGIAPLFIPIYLGNGFDLSILLFQIFSFLILFVGFAYITGYAYLIPTEQQNVYTISVSIAAIINLILNIILIKKYGAVGAAISSIIAELIASTIQIGYCIYTKQLNTKDIFHPAVKCLSASIIMYIEIVFWVSRVKIGIIQLVMIVLISMILYFILLLIFRDSIIIKYTKKTIYKIINLLN